MVSHVVQIEQKIRKVASLLDWELNQSLPQDKAIAAGATAKFPFCRQGRERRLLKESIAQYQREVEKNKALEKRINGQVSQTCMLSWIFGRNKQAEL